VQRTAQHAERPATLRPSRRSRIDFAAPHGVFSVALCFDPELEASLIAGAMRPVQAQAGFSVLPNYCFADRPAMDAFLIPGGFGARQEMRNGCMSSSTASRRRRC
jgi:hypothetical protein